MGNALFVLHQYRQCSQCFGGFTAGILESTSDFGFKQGIDYNSNLFKCNDVIQKDNNEKWNSQRRQTPNKGVQIQKAY